MDHDHAVFRRFRGDASIERYLTTVLSNLLKDYKNQTLGKWRPSAAARRAGPTAVALERLIYRDRVPLSSAVEQLRTQGYGHLTPGKAAALVQQFPRRQRRSFENGSALEQLHEPSSADQRLWDAQRREALKRARAALDASLAELGSEDRIILQMRFEQEVSVADIARRLGLPQKPLYRRIHRCLDRLRRSPALADLSLEDLDG